MVKQKSTYICKSHSGSIPYSESSVPHRKQNKKMLYFHGIFV